MFLWTRNWSQSFFQRYWVNSQFHLQSSISLTTLYFLLWKCSWIRAFFHNSRLFWRHQLPSIISRVLSLLHGSTWNDSLCQGCCLYFTKIIAATHGDIQLLRYHKIPKNWTNPACAFHLLGVFKFRLNFDYVFRTGWNFLI